MKSKKGIKLVKQVKTISEAGLCVARTLSVLSLLERAWTLNVDIQNQFCLFLVASSSKHSPLPYLTGRYTEKPKTADDSTGMIW